MSIPRVLPGNPPELVVYDRSQDCPYLPDRVARMPLRLPARALDRVELEERLATGDRRQGFVLYRTACPSCRACEPIRIDTERFVIAGRLLRVLRRGDQRVRCEIGTPVTDARRVGLYNRHKQERGLGEGQPPIDSEGYQDFLVNSCCESFELSFRVEGELAGVAIVDRADNSLSAVYCYYDPAHRKLSLGTYSILKQIELCRSWGLRYLYLGLYIGDCDKMAYKASFLPHERLVDGSWQNFEKGT